MFAREEPGWMVNLFLALFLTLPFSRKLEAEADYIGLMLIASAGYDPRAAVRVWTKFGQIEESRSKYLSTHPPHNDRSTETSKWMPLALEKYNAGRQSQAM